MLTTGLGLFAPGLLEPLEGEDFLSFSSEPDVTCLAIVMFVEA